MRPSRRPTISARCSPSGSAGEGAGRGAALSGSAAALERLRLGWRLEQDAARGTQPYPVLEHTGGDAIDIGNEFAAQPKRVGLTGLPLLLRALGGGRLAHEA